MDFDLSKENIQPLRGGRNVSQLEVALQAQSDTELQKELLQQKESFEEAIRTYEGEDPLENWYNYIYWVEQSYPKHGHEGNLVPLLEDCLTKFEHNDKYMHDRRLCKLWIKYIDLQQNPLELFQLLHSKGICVSCADLYRAWAYYHEVAGDHKRADVVFELGIGALAQPYEDLVIARNNMYTAIGKQAITGVDDRRLVEQRHALTSLQPYIQRQSAMVTSVRTGSHVVLSNTPGVLQQNLPRTDCVSNAPVTFYEDQAVAGPSVGGASAAVSVLDVARRQEKVNKENALKPGTWTSKKNIIGSRVCQQRAPGFKIHEDVSEAREEGIRLPPDFAPMNHDDFSTWETMLVYPEPANPNHIPMYPKHLVYAEPNCEYSFEEIRARKWFAQQPSDVAEVAPDNASLNMQENITEEANIYSCSQHMPLESQLPLSYSNPISQSIPCSGNSINQSIPCSGNSINQSIPCSGNSINQSIPCSGNSINQSIPCSGNSISQSIPCSGNSINQSIPSSGHLIGQSISSSGNSNNQEMIAAVTTANSLSVPASSSFHSQSIPSASNTISQCQVFTQNYAFSRPSTDTHNVSRQQQYTQYQESPQNAGAQNQSLKQQSLLNYRSEIGQRFRQCTQNQESLNYDLDSENHSLRQYSAQYHLPSQNYTLESQTSNQNVQQSSAVKNMIYQDQPSNSSAEVFAHQQSYAIQPAVPNQQLYATQPTVPNQGFSVQPTVPAQLYSAPTTVPLYQHPVATKNPAQCWPDNTLGNDDNYTVNMREAIKDINYMWKDNLSTLPDPVVEVKKPVITKFQIHEDTEFLRDDASDHRKSVVKTSPIVIFKDDDESSVSSSGRKWQETSQMHNNNDPTGALNRTHEMQYNSGKSSKPGNKLKFGIYEEPTGRIARTPFASHPLPDREYSSRPAIDKFTQPAEHRKSSAFPVLHSSTVAGESPLNDTCTTQMFNFNLNRMQAHSTPFHCKKSAVQHHQNYPNATIFGSAGEEATDRHVASDKALSYAQEEIKEKSEQYSVPPLSVILETTKEYRSSSSSSSGGTTLKTTTSNFRESLKVIPESSVQSCHDSGMELKVANTVEKTVAHFAENSDDSEKSTINDYSMIKDLLRYGEDNEQKYRPSVMILDACSQRENISYLPIQQVARPENHIIDLTDDDNNKAQKSQYLMRCSEVSNLDFAGFNVQCQRQFDTSVEQTNNLMFIAGKETGNFSKQDTCSMKNQAQPFDTVSRSVSKDFESPRKTLQFYENSNDSMSCSPIKGCRMDMDAVLKTHNSNSQFKMDYDSCQEAPLAHIKEDQVLQEALSDPFSYKLINALLNKTGFPNPKYAKSFMTVQSLPRIVKKEMGKKEIISLGDEKYMVEKVIGKGAYGTVYKAIHESTNAMVALKYQKPANQWEFYICKEIRERITNPYLFNAFMDVSACYVSHNGSMLISEFFKLGSLLDLSNKVKQVTGKGVKELVAIYYASEIITIVNALHRCQIIHADIKPDNFLVTRMPPEFGHPSLQLIDFGCSIDMSLFPQGSTFTKCISTENFTCTEMKDGRPWTYQTDIFCIAATVHVLLFEKYMQLQKRGEVWSITQNIPRYMRKDLWNTFFFQMLNIDGCDRLPDLNAIKSSFDAVLSTQSEDLQVDMRFVANSIYGK